MTQNTLQLTFPQWQGAPRRYAVQAAPELPEQDAVQGYMLGAELLAWLLPENPYHKAVIPVASDLSDEARAEKHGIESYDAVARQLDQAFEVINRIQPAKILTLGGDCSVSLAPFSYLARQYGDDLAVIWIDAHHDLVAPFEAGYPGFHGMVLRLLAGEGEPQILNRLPATIAGGQVAFAGLREQDPNTPQRLGMTQFTVARLRENLSLVAQWLAESGKKKIAVHLDLDVFDPNSLGASSWEVPNGLTTEEVVKITAELAQIGEVVGLSITESLPREVIKLRNLLRQLPIIKQG